MLSKYAWFIAAIILCYTSFFFYPRWKKESTEAAISWDVSGYYWYLPSVFIYKDLKHQSFKDSILLKYNPTTDKNDFQQAVLLGNGNYVMKYSSGMAVMYLPFFAAAHLLAGPLGYPRDGFSLPYQFALQFGALLVSLLGLWFFRKLFLIFYPDKVVAVILLLLVLGTNYLNYAAIDNGMSHAWLFTLYVFLLLNTVSFYSSFKSRYAVRIGLLVGLLTLSRPTEIISCLIPLLWGMDSISFRAIRGRVSLLFMRYRQFLLAAASAGAVISIQLVYWKYVSGHWVVYSYQDQKLYFRSPNFVNYTFSYISGWLLYTPMMALAFLGIIPFLLKGKNKLAIITFFLLNYYVVCAWNIWWYGGRAMVQSYPVLFFPVAALVHEVLRRKMWLWLFAPVAVLFVYVNIWVTYFSHSNTLFNFEHMTRAYFWRAIGRWKAPGDIILLKDNPDLFEGTPEDTHVIYENHFANDTGVVYVFDAKKNSTSVMLTKEHQNSPVYTFPFSGRQARWIKVQATFHCMVRENNIWKMTQFIVRLTYKGAIVKESTVHVQHVLNDWQTGAVPVYVKLPSTPFDSVNVLFWNADSDQPIWINDIEAVSFNE